ncbi:hypothetical protein OESDEN_15133 [Oesophagostomum dentatum]|uniref:Uncharacterized protein n=1 Tax=Oesophagostomum dentatum TaxID=61180 RepID=A0A0B1SPS0_OESDE|nr:hypothetical protein OESDEN_15133 [Oesophagostomum dentatum]
MEFINNIGYDFFALKDANTTGGLWAYGYTDFPTSPDLTKMTGSREEFEKQLEKMKFTEAGDPLTTEMAIRVINNLPAGDIRINCLVFFSAQKNTQQLTPIDPKNKEIKRIVAVGYDSTDLTKVVGTRGIAVSVPYYWKDSDVENVVKAIQGTYKPPTPKPSTTPRPTTTPSKLQPFFLLPN